MITRRRRLGSETEQQQNNSEPVTLNQVLKGPSSILLGSGNNFHQPSFFIVPAETQSPTIPSIPTLATSDVRVKPAIDSGTMSIAGNSNFSLPPSSSSSSRDRTQEFFSAVKSCQSRPHNGMVGNGGNYLQMRRPQQSHQHHSEFMRAAKEISTDLTVTYARLEQLADLAKKQSIFDDTPTLIHDLTRIIQEDIRVLNKKIGQLRDFMKQQQGQKHSTTTHSTNVVFSLQSKLATMSSEFKQVLEVRTENMKVQQSRREKYVTRDPILSDLPPAALTGGPFGSSQLGGSGSVLLRDAQTHGLNSVSIDIGAAGNVNTQTQMQLSADETESYLRSRSDAVQTIESTVVELGGIFNQLALMVKEQEETVQRIDANVDDAHLNVEAAHDELLRYFRSVTSNRWLMFKVFGVVIVFIIIFAIFFA